MRLWLAWGLAIHPRLRISGDATPAPPAGSRHKQRPARVFCTEDVLVSVVDTHFHLWDLAHPQLRYRWLAPDEAHVMLGNIRPLCRPYLLADFLADTESIGVQKGIHVQCADGPEDPVTETRWLQGIADAHGWPHGIVAFVDLQDGDAIRHLEQQTEYPNVRGIRDLRVGSPFNWEDKRFRANVRSLSSFGLHYELRARVPELLRACGLVRAADDVPIVLTHAGLPIERDPEYLAVWRRGIRALSACANVVCKLSAFGMMSHINGTAFEPNSLRPLVSELLDAFGPDRLMFGGNWLVDRLTCTYEALIETYRACLTDLTAEERNRVFSGNAENFYRL
jgi:predicted TIM-barrel fold metal-dependent hydrolase